MSDPAEVIRAVLEQAHEWAAKYPLQGQGSPADEGAAMTVYSQIPDGLTALDTLVAQRDEARAGSDLAVLSLFATPPWRERAEKAEARAERAEKELADFLDNTTPDFEAVVTEAEGARKRAEIAEAALVNTRQKNDRLQGRLNSAEKEHEVERERADDNYAAYVRVKEKHSAAVADRDAYKQELEEIQARLNAVVTVVWLYQEMLDPEDVTEEDLWIREVCGAAFSNPAAALGVSETTKGAE